MTDVCALRKVEIGWAVHSDNEVPVPPETQQVHCIGKEEAGWIISVGDLCREQTQAVVI